MKQSSTFSYRVFPSFHGAGWCGVCYEHNSLTGDWFKFFIREESEIEACEACKMQVELYRANEQVYARQQLMRPRNFMVV